MEKLVFMSTQRYYAPFRKVGKRFVGILSVELDRVCARKWNAERVIVFQPVIIQRAQGVTNYAQILKRIYFLLDLWNRGAFEELVKDTYNSAMGYLGKAREIQTPEELHGTFSNLVLKGKLREAVQFVCDREKGGVLQPDKLSKDCTGTIKETVA